ncbi:MAG: hypothetical protein QOE70_1793 [Chthoniobacter sp.]|jgi:PAS domain S-box-containing protein|nr:hypothetical protein [Chthoniobacter sp.]
MISAQVKRRFNDLPIKTKVSAVIYVVSLVVLLTASGALFASQMHIMRTTFEHDLEVLATSLADNCAAPLAFNDAKVASQTLASLSAKPEVIRADLITLDDKILAQFGDADDPTEIEDLRDGLQVGAKNHWTLVRPVVFNELRIGSLRICVDYASVQSRLARLYAGTTALVLAVSLALALGLTAKLQPLITRPIAELAAAARKVATHNDYTIRAPKFANDELGQLTDAFNQMLEEIHGQNVALRESEQRFRSVAETAGDAIIIADRGTRILSWNPAACRMFGYQADEIVGQPLAVILPERFRAADPAGRGLFETTGAGEMIGRTVELAGLRKDGTEFPFELSLATWKTDGGTFFCGVIRDIAERKNAEEALRDSQQRLLETSRNAGMAEVATNVLHNVGNVLNSVNVSCTLIADKVRKSRIIHVANTAQLLRQHAGDLAAFLTTDATGQKLPDFLGKLAERLAEDQVSVLEEIRSLSTNIEHIKEIVVVQQKYANVGGVSEMVPLAGLVEDALTMHGAKLMRHGVEIFREFAEIPCVCTEKHKVLQILVNLVRNAKHALTDGGRADKRLVVRIARTAVGRVALSVSDNGIGILPENITRIFSHGFTTKKDGHGFGLHSGVLAARELGGSLTVQSDGLAKGATFTLELPFTPNGRNPGLWQPPAPLESGPPSSPSRNHPTP